MSTRISFAGDGAEIVIMVTGYENPLAQNADDASWVNAEVAVRVGSFTGAYKTAFTTYDLAVLHARLEQALKALSGRISFQNTDGDLTLKIEFSKGGKAQVDGVAEPPGSVKAALHFGFGSEAGALSETLRELRETTDRFPVKQVQS